MMCQHLKNLSIDGVILGFCTFEACEFVLYSRHRITSQYSINAIIAMRLSSSNKQTNAIKSVVLF